MKRKNIVPRRWGNSLHFDYRHRIPIDLVSRFNGKRQFQISLKNVSNREIVVVQWSNRHYRRYKYNDENVACDPGKYRAVVNIPGYILNSGKYKLNVNLIYGDNLYEFNEKGILFELFDLRQMHR